jgi:hypothetical protein
MSGGSFGFGKGESESSGSQRVNVPDYLQPFLNQAAGTAGSSLSQLSNLAYGNLVAPFTDAEQQGQQLGIDRALGAGGFLPTAENTLLGAAQGTDISSFLPPSAFQGLSQLAQGGGAQSLLPPEAYASLLGASQIPGEANEALLSTARGDNLFGGAGFDRAVEAAMNAARPAIGSAFGRAGAGASSGGLAQTALGTAAVDAFARQYGQERANQLGAANTLSGRGIQAGGLLGSLGDASAGRQLGAGSVLGNLGSAERSRQIGAAQSLPGLSQFGSNVLQGIGGTQRGLNQMGIDAPRMAQLQLLQSALGFPAAFSPLFGQDMSGNQSTRQFGFKLPWT